MWRVPLNLPVLLFFFFSKDGCVACHGSHDSPPPPLHWLLAQKGTFPSPYLPLLLLVGNLFESAFPWLCCLGLLLSTPSHPSPASILLFSHIHLLMAP